MILSQPHSLAHLQVRRVETQKMIPVELDGVARFPSTVAYSVERNLPQQVCSS